MLSGKKILLGVCGSIAAYKAADLVRELGRQGAMVTVVMTESAGRFVTPLTFAALSGRPVHSAMFSPDGAEKIPHISLAREHDLILIAPATAQTLARLAMGLADDLLATVVLAARCPVLFCPAMNAKMFDHPATSANLQRLRDFGYTMVEPAVGAMACGEEGSGRLADWPHILSTLRQALSPQDLAGKKVMITAGPTEEPLDPVRYISNRSSGRMGYALAGVARERGASVLLISGPSQLPPPPGVELVRVRTAAEMAQEVFARFAAADIVVKCAAVSDFRPAECAPQKLKKASGSLELALAANEDILQELGRRKDGQFLVGFAAESENHLAEGRRKLAAKNLDMIVVNDIGSAATGFISETNAVTILGASGEELEVSLRSKEEVAMVVFSQVVTGLGEGHGD
ncbi:MAG: bifunctional phosphopantothenoylcysteine decarboxylase/phosphopantothenate--cysteine ligase CoaBC [Thermodesulfobacteriota bacterium]